MASVGPSACPMFDVSARGWTCLLLHGGHEQGTVCWMFAVCLLGDLGFRGLGVWGGGGVGGFRVYGFGVLKREPERLKVSRIGRSTLQSAVP